MTAQAGFAGAIGPSASSLLAKNHAGARPLREAGGGVLFVADRARSFAHQQSQCAVLGSPRLCGSVAERGQGSRADESWTNLLHCTAAELDHRLRGHFALLVADLPERTVLLVTDRFGSYPIYYRVFADGLAFSDRADLLFDTRPSLSAQAVFDYLYFHCLPGPGTVHDGVRKLEPGRALRWHGGELTEEAYWARRPRASLYSNFGAAKTDFRELLQAAVEQECATDGTTGAFLSGGTDSSTVVGLLAERSATPVRSYSIGFDVEGYDEAAYARLAAKHFGSEHKVYYVTPDDLVQRLPAAAEHLDQPFGNSSLLPAIVCAERARDDGVSKLLAGDGGDELFGGNTRYAKQQIFAWYDRLPGMVRRGILEPFAGSPISALPLMRKVRNYVNQAKVPMPDRLESYNLLEREGVGNVFPEGWLRQIDVDHPRRLQRDVWKHLAADNLIDRMLEFDWKFTLADNDLRKVRYASDIAGVAAGFPLLADELADFALRLDPEWKVRRFKLRWFFKEALSDFLPPEIIRKKKHGFGLPFGSWVCEHEGLRRMALDAVHGLVDRGVVKDSYVKSLLDDRLPQHPYFYGEMVWILMMLELWLRAHSPDWRAGAV